jgi:uncharacterized protein YoxC
MNFNLVAQICVVLGAIGLLVFVVRLGTTLEKVLVILGLIASFFLMFAK